MAGDTGAPSEFGGKQMRNHVQPPVTPTGKKGHKPTPSEEMMLTYTTGDPSGLSRPDGGEAFAGLLPYDEALAVAPKPELFTDFEE